MILQSYRPSNKTQHVFFANKGCLTIDEVQRALDIFLAIKHEVDAMRMAGINANVLLLPK
jgi:predicted AAA+ superfamily ATPase